MSVREGVEEYIGDGVYASFDGYQIWLRTARDNGDHSIALDEPTFAALIGFRERLSQPKE